MVNFETSATHSIPRPANEVVLKASAVGALPESRRRRLRKLREAIDSGHYRVSADDLAHALLRSVHQVN